MSNKIIGIVGVKNSGKSETAKYISEKYGHIRKSIATPIKQILKIIGVPDKNLFGSNDEKNEIIPLFNKNARKLMQFTGTEFGRDSLHKDVWINLLMNSLEDNKDYIIDDIRFVNEAEMIKEKGGLIIGILRPNLVLGPDFHQSEFGFYDKPFQLMVDNWIMNDGTKEQLYANIDKIINE